MKTPEDSKSYIAQIVGEESLLGERMSAGKLLRMMDMVAGSAAARHAECALVTLAFDRIELLDFIFHLDYVRYDAYVIKVGRSSIVVKVDGYTKSPTEMEIHPAHSGFITMVAIDADKKPNRNIPGLAYATAADKEKKKISIERARLLEARKKEVDKIDRLEKIDRVDLIDPCQRNSRFHPSQTVLNVRNMFLPRNANALGIVFGGDTIEMMEELALATARQFTGNIRMVTIAMEDVLFLKPLDIYNIVEMSAVVTFVTQVTLTVAVTVRSIDFFKPEKSHITNKGIFTVLSYDRSGRKKAITRGLDLSEAGMAEKRAYLKEQVKYMGRKKEVQPE